MGTGTSRSVDRLQYRGYTDINMGKGWKQQEEQGEEILPEYNFSGGVRGKHHKAYREGHSARVKNADGAVVEQHFTLEDGAVMLDADVREYFPDSEAVNKALRTLITLVRKKGRSRTKAK